MANWTPVSIMTETRFSIYLVIMDTGVHFEANKRQGPHPFRNTAHHLTGTSGILRLPTKLASALGLLNTVINGCPFRPA